MIITLIGVVLIICVLIICLVMTLCGIALVVFFCSTASSQVRILDRRQGRGRVRERPDPRWDEVFHG